MNILENLFTYINISIAIIFLINILISYKKGLVYELAKFGFALIAVYIAWRFGKIFSVSLPIIHFKNSILASLTKIETFANQVLWTAIVYAVLRIIIIIIMPLLKFLSEVPIIGLFNKIGGIFFGILRSIVIVMIFSLLLSTPLVKNGEQIKNGTVIHYISSFTDKLYKTIMENNGLTEIGENIDYKKMLNEMNSMTDESAVAIQEKLKEMGIDSLDDIDINSLSSDQKTKLWELYLKYRKTDE